MNEKAFGPVRIWRKISRIRQHEVFQKSARFRNREHKSSRHYSRMNEISESAPCRIMRADDTCWENAEKPIPHGAIERSRAPGKITLKIMSLN
ncbi:MAG: hypothetical protein ABIS51_21540 [Sphingomonas sp.]